MIDDRTSARQKGIASAVAAAVEDAVRAQGVSGVCIVGRVADHYRVGLVFAKKPLRCFRLAAGVDVVQTEHVVKGIFHPENMQMPYQHLLL